MMKSYEYIILAAYFIGMLVIGIICNRKQTDMTDYYVGGRNKGAFSIAALWVSGWVGGASILGTATKAYNLGITAAWYVTIIGVSCVIFALTFSGAINRIGTTMEHLTYADFLASRYDDRSAIMATISNIIANTAYTAAQLVAAATIINYMFNINLTLSFILATSVVILYTTLGGFNAVTYTDWVQFILILIGCVILGVPLALKEVGGLHQLAAQLPDRFMDVGAWGWRSLLGFATSMILTFFTSMDSYTKCYSAKNVKTSQRGMYIAAATLILIAISCTLLGLVSFVLLPDLADGGTNALTNLIFKIFPVGIRTVLLTAILAAVMSSADISVLSASVCVVNDVYLRFNPEKREKKYEKRMLKLSILTSLIVGIIGAFIAWKLMDIMNILYIAFTFNSAALFFPTISAIYLKKANRHASFYSMLGSLVVVIVWYLGTTLHWGDIFSGVDPLWPGLITSAVIFFGHTFLAKPTQEDSSDWAHYHKKQA